MGNKQHVNRTTEQKWELIETKYKAMIDEGEDNIDEDKQLIQLWNLVDALVYNYEIEEEDKKQARKMLQQKEEYKHEVEVECYSCGEEGDTENSEACLKSKRKCGHHCNHILTHDQCCWCNKESGEYKE